MKTGLADLPLHWGKAPKWLFERMKELGKEICVILIDEYGKKEFLKRISDPFWFQAFSCILGYDWHSSGCTTVTCAVLKEVFKEDELGVYVLGGKGKTSKKTPEEIEKIGEKLSLSSRKIEELKKTSRLVAKVDNVALQDNFQLYHHSFILTENGEWAVIQQGMNSSNRLARRYHWLSFEVESFVKEPHKAICCDVKVKALNMVAREVEETRKICVDLIKDNPCHLKKYLIQNSENSLIKYLRMPSTHWIKVKNYEKIFDNFYKAYESQPKTFEELLQIRGVGPNTIRALALIAKLIFGAPLSWNDPAKYSFAHGGKDGTPYPVDKKTYDRSIQILKDAIENAKLGRKEKIEAIKKLESFW